MIIILIIIGISNFFNKSNLNEKVEGYYNVAKEEAVFEKRKNLEENTEDIIDPLLWKIEIPKISLKASIGEGTTKEILNQFVGHFEETPKDNGNIGLAAHNRGYPVNYFERVKELEVGDEIIYTYNGIQRKYIVEIVSIIKDTDWSKLENTQDNRITLITCVENVPDSRRCIQGIEIQDDDGL